MTPRGWIEFWMGFGVLVAAVSWSVWAAAAEARAGHLPPGRLALAICSNEMEICR